MLTVCPAHSTGVRAGKWRPNGGGVPILFLILVGTLAAAGAPLPQPSAQPKVAEASDEGELAIKRFVVPPIANLADGPSGFTYYPGTGMPERFNDHFFLCDFHGGKGSGIHSFALKPSRASFQLVDRQNFLWECLPTEVDFGVDGGVYYTDWVQGWGKTGKGRIYRVYDPQAVDQPIVGLTKRLLAEGFEHRPTPESIALLTHRDLRVRQSAQFTLANRGAAVIPALADTAKGQSDLLARLHAIWALGQILTQPKNHLSPSNESAATETLLASVTDPDPEVRAQSAKVLGDARAAPAFEPLVRLLSDSAPRLRFFAAISLGKLGRSEAVTPLLALLRDNADQDPYLRHAAFPSKICGT